MTPFSILFENDEILLVNKPNGVSVQGGKGIFHPLDTELSTQLGYKIHLVHRLDKDTAGILVVAKNPVAAAKWTKLIGQKEVKKEYTAICIGKPVVKGKTVDSGTLEGIVEAHGREQTANLSFSVQESREFEVTKTSEDGQTVLDKQKIVLSKIAIKLGTGRMHQIRIQMAKALSPVAADDQHGNFKQNKLLRKLGIKKLCLAATKLTIPVAGKSMVFEIPLPDHMKIFEN